MNELQNKQTRTHTKKDNEQNSFVECLYEKKIAKNGKFQQVDWLK